MEAILGEQKTPSFQCQLWPLPVNRDAWSPIYGKNHHLEKDFFVYLVTSDYNSEKLGSLISLNRKTPE